MRKILIFGNSGSGKSTRARALVESDALAHLDLDTLAWKPSAGPDAAPERQPLEVSQRQILKFIDDNHGWVIEGCYADLLQLVTDNATEMLYLNPPTTTCIEHARKRPWEPHKYSSKQAQDQNLPMLIDWIQQYTTRDDDFSEHAHRKLYESFSGVKQMLS